MERVRNENIHLLKVEERVNMANDRGINQERERTLEEYWKLVIHRDYSPVRRTPITTNNFELKPSLINLVQSRQFMGHPSEDSNEHLSNFLQVVDTIKVNGVSHKVIKIKLFPFSLREKLRHWNKSLQPCSILLRIS